MLDAARNRLRRASRLAQCTLAAIVLYVPLRWAAPDSAFTAIARLLLISCAFAWLFRAARGGLRRAIWSLRNRLLVTYLFIAVVPVVLVIALALIGAWTIGSQVALYLATSELDRRASTLHFSVETIARAAPNERFATMQGMGQTFFEREFPGIVFAVNHGGEIARWPAGAAFKEPIGWKDASGIVLDGDRTYLWAHLVRGDTAFTARAPLTPRFLSSLVPGLLVSLIDTDAIPSAANESFAPATNFADGRIRLRPAASGLAQKLPTPANRFDVPIAYFLPTTVASWDEPRRERLMLLYIRTRPSVLLGILNAHKVGDVNVLLPYLLAGIPIVFLIVELGSLVIGVSLTRTITYAVHELYRGTQKVIEGDFSHRIPVRRNDQLGELTTSFNVMTGNVERLLSVAKEKERLQSELEIAREVQDQLYPRVKPALRTLRLTGLCKPARTVSGDYYDYVALDENRLAISIGDVSGKGISAALLMATLQSSVRAQMRSAVQYASLNHQPHACLSTSHLVSELNRQVHAFTSPEKYATFCLGIYDDESGVLRYTNAGHLPPVLIRHGRAMPFDVNGMVVGAFSFAQYEESRVELLPGDLLMCYTDGLTEPENAYGEMFGDERLIDLVVRNAAHTEEEIIRMAMEAVEQWAGAVEQFDDMTMLLARRC